MSAWPSVTVNVLTWNGEQHLDALLTAVEQQDYAGDIEILVIDSGSTDSTLSIIAQHPRVRLHEIPNEEFGHGSTRNLAAQLATGEFVAYLTHDAVPARPDWLRWLVHPMITDERVAAVVGKQAPRRGAPPVLKYDIQRVFERLGPDYGTTIVVNDGRPMDAATHTAATFYSDANSAARASVLRGAVPYRDVSYAEDQLFGKDLFDAGFAKAYSPAAVVEHSNDLTWRSSGTRIVDEIVGLRRIGTEIPPLSWFGALKQSVKWSIVDAGYILVDKDLSAAAKFGWIFANPFWHLQKWFSFRRGTRQAI